MDKRTVLATTGGIEIKYEFRHNRVLLMFCSFSDNQLPHFADLLHEGCHQINTVEKLIRYDDQTSAIIITLNVGYNEELANTEIREVFEYYFLHKT